MTIASTSDTTRSDAPAETPLLVVSADTHVGPRMQDFRDYCPKKYLAAFDEFGASEYAQAGANNEQFDLIFSEAYRNGLQRNRKTLGHYDPHARLRDMDRDGVAGGVIFHFSQNGEVFPFDLSNLIGGIIPAPEARELAGVGRSMYNRWLADFCSVEPGRSLGLAQLPFWDIDAAVKELEWCAENGLAGVNFPAPGQPGMVQPSHPDFDRFFAAAAALDMTLATHIGASPPAPDVPPSESGATTSAAAGLDFSLIDIGDWGSRAIYVLCIFGVFERFPNLRLVITEIPGVYWNDFALKMDSVHLSPMRRRNDVLARRPSEYMDTNLWLGNSFQSRQEAVDAIEIGREDRFMWGSDYPHGEGTWTYAEDPSEYPMTKLALATTYHDLPVDKVRKMVGINALEAYPRSDRAVLNEVANRVGVSVDEIATEPDLSKYPFVDDSGSMGFRKYGPWS